MSEPYWLIECKLGCGWWHGRGRVDCRLFTKTPLEARRFSSRQEAEALLVNSCQIATEHIDIGPAKAKP